MHIKLFITAICLSLPFMACVKNMAGGSTETTNPAVVGILYQPDGKTPAAGVRVHIRPQKTLADTTGAGLTKRLAVLAAVDSVVTDNAGRYAFDTTIDTGTFVIEAASGNNAVLIDSVAVKNKAVTDTVAPDTLKPAGALKGVIYLSEGGDPRKVFVLAFGIDRFAKVNTDGSFKFSGLAEAKYDLRLISGLDNYGVLDTSAILVRSADTTNLDTIKLPFTGIPTPKNVRISYDTLKQIVTLTWDSANASQVSYYNIYRRNSTADSLPVKINTSPVRITTYTDKTSARTTSAFDSTILKGITYEYQVAAVDMNGTEGTKSTSISVLKISAYALISTIVLDSSGRYDPIALAVAQDTTFYVAYRGNNDGFIGMYDHSGRLLRNVGVGMFTQLFDIAIDSKKNIYAVDPDRKSGQITKFNTAGDSIATWLIYYPTSVAIDASDKIYLVTNNGQELIVYDTTGNRQDSLIAPTSKFINVKPSPGNKGVWVGDYASGNIRHFQPNLVLAGILTITQGPINEPYGLRGVDDSDFCYVSEYQRPVFVFNSTSTLKSWWDPGIWESLALMNKSVYVLSQSQDGPWGVILVYRLP
jgi:hypothetical protein